MSYYLLPKNNNVIIINPCIGLIETTPYISHSLYNFYHNIKTQIGSMCGDLSYNEYMEIIKIVNPTEYIFSKVPGSKFSVSKLKPKTNIFYEYLEITSTLNIFEPFKNKSIKSLHISSSCDDSIECIEMIRDNFNNDTFFSFEKINDETYKSIINEKFDFMFFDKKHDNLNSYVINCIKIIMTILRFQINNGISIIKIDCVFHKQIVDILYLITSLFDKVYVIKPTATNVTTFDKYLVCKGFITNESKLEIYKENYTKLNNFIKTYKHENISTIIGNNIPYYFNNKIDDMNNIIGQQQLESLDMIISILKNKNKEDKIEIIKKMNIQKSANWCEKFKIPYNKFSDKTNIFLPIVRDLKETCNSNNEIGLFEETHD
jgi:hypothetical protein